MKKITSPEQLDLVIKTNPYILSLEKEETNVLVEVVTDFQTRNYDSAPKTESLLKALKEIQNGQKNTPILEDNCEVCE